MNIKLKTLSLRNFKGIKKLTISFTHETNIFGENASGKTTVFDAFLWLLFDKDSTDRKTFNIKTLDKNNQAISKLEHEVSATIDVDGQPIELRKVYKEKWVTKRGENTADFAGHENEFFYNDVPLQLAEYKAKIDAILKEDIFKLITNSLYFNTIKWQDRRNVLLQVAGHITDQDVVNAIPSKNKGDYQNLLYILSCGKTLAEYRSQIAAKKKKIKDELVLIPSRIDEAGRSMPDEIDYNVVESRLANLNIIVNNIDNDIANQNQAYQTKYAAIQEKQNELHSLKTAQSNISFKIRNDIQQAVGNVGLTRSNYNNQVRNIELDIQTKNNQLNWANNKKTELAGRREVLLGQWKTINADELKFDDHAFSCPTCKREFEAGDVEAKKELLLENFNTEKNRQLAANRTIGLQIKTEVEQCDETITKLTPEIEALNESLISVKQQFADWEGSLTTAVDPQKQLDEALSANDEYVFLGARIAGVEAEITVVPVVDNSKLKEDKAAYQLEIDILKKQWNSRDLIDRINKRIEELKLEESRMSQEIADLEQTEFLIDDFDKTKMNIIESRINGKFKYVTFKMFNRQINGGEDPCCETLINGVPFSDANNAARINAGIDIINVLCEHYQVWAPIFIDNRESVSELIPCKSQIVNLVVVKGTKLSVNEIEYKAGHLAVA